LSFFNFHLTIADLLRLGKNPSLANDQMKDVK